MFKNTIPDSGEWFEPEESKKKASDLMNKVKVKTFTNQLNWNTYQT